MPCINCDKAGICQNRCSTTQIRTESSFEIENNEQEATKLQDELRLLLVGLKEMEKDNRNQAHLKPEYRLHFLGCETGLQIARIRLEETLRKCGKTFPATINVAGT
ncbi:hypothetical protein QUN99_003419 [Vibrio parahaemolyticus]|nr:hypothetical protein [Vibrio parahaemolyticus]